MNRKRVVWMVGIAGAFLGGAAANFLTGSFLYSIVPSVIIGAVCGVAIFRCQGDQRGSAVLEAILGMGLLVLPMTFLITTTAWPARLNAASAAAYQAAKTVAEAPDPVTGEDLGRQRAADVMANHGFDPGTIAVSYSTPDPQRSDQVTATVTVALPALSFPSLGSWDAVGWDRSATVEVPSYRSFG